MELKRYRIGAEWPDEPGWRIVEDPDGEWVKHAEAAEEIERLRALLRQWRHAYADNIDDYEALEAAQDATDEALGQETPGA